jgi:hypothetical protein
MITIDRVSEMPMPQGARKGTLTKKAATARRAAIEWAMQEHGQRLGPSAITFLHSISLQLNAPVARLSKKQLDVIDEIVLQASFGEPLVILEGDAIADLGMLFRYASGDSRISSYEEFVIVRLKYRVHEPVIALSQGTWRTINNIRRKTRFDLPGEPIPMDIDGVVENDDPDGLPLDRSEIEAERVRDWASVGVVDDHDL